VASREVRHDVRIVFDEPFNFVAESLYAGVKRNYRTEAMVITYVDDRAPTWKMSAKQVNKDGSLSPRPASEYDGTYGMDKEDVVRLNEIARSEDPRIKEED
jgi:hypothetical protein